MVGSGLRQRQPSWTFGAVPILRQRASSRKRTIGPLRPSSRRAVAELSVGGQSRPELGHGVSLREAFWTWLRVAGLSFGGPALPERVRQFTELREQFRIARSTT